MEAGICISPNQGECVLREISEHTFINAAIYGGESFVHVYSVGCCAFFVSLIACIESISGWL
jgi:hypothetical protein